MASSSGINPRISVGSLFPSWNPLSWDAGTLFGLGTSLINGLNFYFGQKTANETNKQIASDYNTMQQQIAEKTNAANKAIADQNIAYQRELNQQIFAREDNAFQRQVADLKAAGLSPLLASGAGAGAGGTVSAPQSNQQVQSPSMTKYEAVPQILKFSGELQQAIEYFSARSISAAQIDETKRHNLAQEQLDSINRTLQAYILEYLKDHNINSLDDIFNIGTSLLEHTQNKAQSMVDSVVNKNHTNMSLSQKYDYQVKAPHSAEEAQRNAAQANKKAADTQERSDQKTIQMIKSLHFDRANYTESIHHVFDLIDEQTNDMDTIKQYLRAFAESHDLDFTSVYDKYKSYHESAKTQTQKQRRSNFSVAY